MRYAVMLLVLLLQERNACCHRDCAVCDTERAAIAGGKNWSDCSPVMIQLSEAIDHMSRCDIGTAPCQLSKQTNKTDVYQALWWRHISYIINRWYVTVSIAVQQYAMMCFTLLITAAVIVIGTLIIRPTLRNRVLQLFQHWKVAARDAIIAIQQGHYMRRWSTLMTVFLVSSILTVALFKGSWSVMRAFNYIEQYVIRIDYMYRHPLMIILVVQSIVGSQAQDVVVRRVACTASTMFILYYSVLSTLFITNQLVDYIGPSETTVMKALRYLVQSLMWHLLLSELGFLLVVAVITCMKLITVITTASATATKFTYHKCRAAAYKAIRAGVKHTLYKLSKTEHAYTRDMMTMCRRCDSSIAIAVNTPCGHTFLCWSCAEQYRDEHGDICNSCHENSTLFKLQQQQMCVICQEQISSHDLFHIKQCGHQVLLAYRPTYHRHSNTLISSQS
jgi:hypothetical protein